MNAIETTYWTRLLAFFSRPLFRFLATFLIGVLSSVVAARMVAERTVPSKDYVDLSLQRLDDKISPVENWVQIAEQKKLIEESVNQARVQQAVDEAVQQHEAGAHNGRRFAVQDPSDTVSLPTGQDSPSLIQLHADVAELRRNRPTNLRPEIEKLGERVGRLEIGRDGSQRGQESELGVQIQQIRGRLEGLEAQIATIEQAQREARERLEGELYQLSLASQPQAASEDCEPPNISRARSFRAPRPLEPTPKATYPAGFEASWLGEIMLCLTISEEGAVIKVENLTRSAPLPFVDEATRAAVRRRYAPGLLNGRPSQWRVIAGATFSRR